LLAPLFAACVSAGVVAVESGAYVVTDSGPVLGPVIVSVYHQATTFCAKQHKEVSTIKLDPAGRGPHREER
jgi:hypothetical protein